MIRQTGQQAKDTRTLRHFTRTQYIDSIAQNGLRLEGSNILEAVRQGDFRYYERAKLVKLQHKLIGRYVWLTKADSVECINAAAHASEDAEALKKLHSMTTSVKITSHEGLNIISWKLIKKELMRKKKSRLIIKSLEKSAIACGDNPDDWYVSKQEIPASCLDIGLKADAKNSLISKLKQLLPIAA